MNILLKLAIEINSQDDTFEILGPNRTINLLGP
jgi:hypothetical protein